MIVKLERDKSAGTPRRDGSQWDGRAMTGDDYAIWCAALTAMIPRGNFNKIMKPVTSKMKLKENY